MSGQLKRCIDETHAIRQMHCVEDDEVSNIDCIVRKKFDTISSKRRVSYTAGHVVRFENVIARRVEVRKVRYLGSVLVDVDNIASIIHVKPTVECPVVRAVSRVYVSIMPRL